VGEEVREGMGRSRIEDGGTDGREGRRRKMGGRWRRRDLRDDGRGRRVIE
jgi:hypothetical protein